MGWIFSPLSPRQIPIDTAKSILKQVHENFPKIQHWAVFAKNDANQILHTMQSLPLLNTAQIVGDLNLSTHIQNNLNISKKHKQNVVPVFRVRGPLQDTDLPVSELIVLDAFVKGKPGGTGKQIRADWINSLKRPFLLAGGLRPQNVSFALQTCGPGVIGADVSSGVESGKNPGHKDSQAVAEFIQQVHKTKQ